MSFSIVTIARNETQKLVSCSQDYAPLPWDSANITVEIVGVGGLQRGIVTLSAATAVSGDNQATITVKDIFSRPTTLKVNLGCNLVPRSFQVVLSA
jgi:hypothetical protein